jgi:hypothetical protein
MNRKMKNNAFSPVVSVVLATAVVVSTIGVIFIGSAPYIESIESQSARENIESQMNIISGVINNLVSSDIGIKKMNPLSFTGGSISSDTYQDRTMMMYSREPGYNFTVTEFNDDFIGVKIIEPVNGIDDLSAVISTPNCFLPGTQVLMADGSYKNIEKIKERDIVFSYCEKEQAIVKCSVTKLFEYELDVETDQTDSYLIINEQLSVTPDHRFYWNKEWIEAGSLTERHNLFTYDSQDYTYPISSIGRSHGLAAQYYDLVIDEGYPYFVYFVDDDVNVLVQSREEELPPESSITVLSPSGGEIWYEGTTYNITWTSEGVNGDVRIGIYVTAIKWAMDIVSSTQNDGLYEWQIPPEILNVVSGEYADQFRIKISEVDNPSVKDSSDEFSIRKKSITLLSPNGGEVWLTNEIYGIIWTSQGVEGNIRLRIYVTEIKWSMDIVSSTQNDGLYEWQIPPEILNVVSGEYADQFRIEISSVDNLLIKDSSDEDFSILSEGTGVFTLDATEITPRTARLNGKLEGISGRVRFEYKIIGGNWIVLPYLPGNYNSGDSFYMDIFGLTPGARYVFQARVKTTSEFELLGESKDFRTYLHEGLPDIIDIPKQDPLLDVNLQGDGIWIIDLPSGLSGTFAIDLYDITDPANSIRFGTIWVFDSNSLEYTRTSSGGTESYVFEKGGILRYDGGKWSVKENKFIYGTDTFFSINMIQTNFSEFYASTGSSNRINLRLSSDLKGSFIAENGLMYNLRLQFFGEYKDSWMEYLSTNYNFKIEYVGSAPLSLRYNSADAEGSVNLALTYSLANLRFQY